MHKLDYGAPVVVLRERLVDETDWILPTSFLPLDQRPCLWASLHQGSAAFSFMTIALRSVLTVSVVHFVRFPFVLQNQLPFPKFKLGLFCEFVDD